jgi:hypothetical protein
MKRLLHIFPALVLSLLIVTMSAGLSVEVCQHTGRTTIAQMPAPRADHQGGCMKHCMIVKTVKLASSTMAHNVVFDFSQQWVAVEPVALLLSLAHTFVPTHAPTVHDHPWYAPPRAYLHLMRVLRL